MILSRAKVLAEEVRQVLAPYCEQIEIAGSIRREKAEVGDIEIICIPKFVEEEAEIEPGLDSFLGDVDLEKGTRKLNILDRELRFYVEHPELSTQPFERGDKRGPEKNINAPFSERYYALKYNGSPWISSAAFHLRSTA